MSRLRRWWPTALVRAPSARLLELARVDWGYSTSPGTGQKMKRKKDRAMKPCLYESESESEN
jgi:hypothetical protein